MNGLLYDEQVALHFVDPAIIYLHTTQHSFLYCRSLLLFMGLKYKILRHPSVDSDESKDALVLPRWSFERSDHSILSTELLFRQWNQNDNQDTRYDAGHLIEEEDNIQRREIIVRYMSISLHTTTTKLNLTGHLGRPQRPQQPPQLEQQTKMDNHHPRLPLYLHLALFLHNGNTRITRHRQGIQNRRRLQAATRHDNLPAGLRPRPLCARPPERNLRPRDGAPVRQPHLPRLQHVLRLRTNRAADACVPVAERARGRGATSCKSQRHSRGISSNMPALLAGACLSNQEK